MQKAEPADIYGVIYMHIYLLIAGALARKDCNNTMVVLSLRACSKLSANPKMSTAFPWGVCLTQSKDKPPEPSSWNQGAPRPTGVHLGRREPSPPRIGPSLLLQ